ncbi:His/Gly/Thr/Pro-type tRNA ligase C-terminal domain-containing protein [Lysinibacillus sp. NPDC093688]|uniref:His/Gly/Thr/Pro-type tRNA ligase C-terminal domain-containing protein n=1 Tax=Lysinibacillus sp. NPDC093688 TaxID=3390577 RepID=UPI003CFED41E
MTKNSSSDIHSSLNDFDIDGNRVEVEQSGKKVREAMDKANLEDIQKTIVLGENEVSANRYKMKDMNSGEQ